MEELYLKNANNLKNNFSEKMCKIFNNRKSFEKLGCEIFFCMIERMNCTHSGLSAAFNTPNQSLDVLHFFMQNTLSSGFIHTQFI